MRVAAVRPSSRRGWVDVYDITVANLHLYFAGDVLVSNSKRISLLDVNALLSHGALHTLRDAGSVRGQRNEDYWLQFMQGYTPRAPRVPMVYEKFVNQLKAAGINVVRDGSQLHVLAMTDKDIDTLAGNRRIRHGDTVRFDKDLAPIPGGLFDPKLTGGHGGRQWAAIDLHEPLPSPIMEEPIRRLLGLTRKQYEGVLAGTQPLGEQSGPRAIAQALDRLNLPKEIAVARAQIASGRRTARDAAVRKLGYLKAAQATGLHPRDWVLSKVPVLPPVFRPATLMGDSGVPLVNDANYLYKELIEADQNLRHMHQTLGPSEVGAERLAVYHALKAVTGLGEPITRKSQERQVHGILKSVFGSSPKFGTVQRKLLSSTVDKVGRAVIVPNPDFDMDTIGIPENQAFEVYGDFIARRLRRHGQPLAQALRHIKERSPLARDMLQQEMAERPVYANRAPVLHKFGIMAFRPKLVAGDVLQVSPLIVKGFNADFDGDAMQFHVPADPEAVKEAYERMLPSRSLLSPADFKTPVHAPGQEYLAGLYLGTARPKKKPGRVAYFASAQDAMRAYEDGRISATTPIKILHG